MRLLTILLGMYNEPFIMMAQPVKTPELHYPMIQFFYNKNSSFSAAHYEMFNSEV